MAIATLISPSKLFYLKLTVNNLPIFTPLLPAVQNSPGLRRKKRPSLHQISAGNTRQSLICSQLRACHESKWLSSSPPSDLATEAFNFSPFRWRSNLTPRKGGHIQMVPRQRKLYLRDRESTTVRPIVADKKEISRLLLWGRETTSQSLSEFLKHPGGTADEKCAASLLLNDSEDWSQTRTLAAARQWVASLRHPGSWWEFTS